MKILILCLLLFFLAGCSGVCEDRSLELCPDSVSVGWAQEEYHGEPDAWQGFTMSATWEIKKR